MICVFSQQDLVRQLLLEEAAAGEESPSVISKSFAREFAVVERARQGTRSHCCPPLRVRATSGAIGKDHFACTVPTASGRCDSLSCSPPPLDAPPLALQDASVRARESRLQDRVAASLEAQLRPPRDDLHNRLAHPSVLQRRVELYSYFRAAFPVAFLCVDHHSVEERTLRTSAPPDDDSLIVEILKD
eukprot:CAMPEP_0182849872 /NCGR_PEP_ID=MMETSP0006_2-20121128/29788_1 /TAXON_ID=97485 /ORGANISM="Prymnesium parvum, Strain Texoma1" /LENGTH=187 /DNA_ID=CAMNT_0024980431 /DNA_START=204 /DNA_END=768 /DNA_ORIENTATION=-